ncbi:MAG: peptide chain release factor N(5)-glutamine methyltransferase [Oscillospiraceae bacterium]|jgi:release factor glutamine methyltransferase|nr:peptide chain release factor N(5)-glutamine methyltransferase [Oscillospiraceae bacterium]
MTLSFDEFEAAVRFLRAAGVEDARWEIARLAREELNSIQFNSILRRRASGIPLQYLLGTSDFYGYTFAVGEGVLIPRPETEYLVAYALNGMELNSIVYDLCAGSGCIGVSIAKEQPQAEVYLFELSEEALFYSRKNAGDLPNTYILRQDITTPPPANLPRPDVIVSNPPYIPTEELPILQREVQKEPPMALDGGTDGLYFYHAIAKYWLPLLRPAGRFVVECGEEQPIIVAQMFANAGYPARTAKDCFGVERFVIAALPE